MKKKVTKKLRRKKAKKDKLWLVVTLLVILLITNFSLMFYLNKQEELKKQRLIDKQEELVKRKQNRKKIKYGDIIFLGDSITDFYDLKKYYEFEIVNSGIAGWTTDDILSHLDEKVFAFDPKRIVLLIGTNDIKHEKTATYIVSNINKIVDKIKKKKPNVKIYVESIYPINNTNQEKIDHKMVANRTNQKIQEVNKKLEKYCKKSNLHYINMYPYLLDSEGNLDIRYTTEGLHISDEGYKIITKKILKELAI